MRACAGSLYPREKVNDCERGRQTVKPLSENGDHLREEIAGVLHRR